MLQKIRRRHIFAIIATAIVVAVAVVAWQTYVYFLPFDAKFRHSKSALDDYAAKVMQNGPASLDHPPSHVGYFNVLKGEPLQHGFILQSDYGNTFDWNGLAYSTEALPEYDHDPKGNIKQVFTRIEGNWYTAFRP